MDGESEIPPVGEEPQGESELGVPPATPNSRAGTSQSPGMGLVIAGTVVVAVWALTSLNSFSTDNAGIALLAAIAAGVVFFLRGSRSPVWTAGTLLIIAAVVAVLGLLDLLAALSDADTIEEYGGFLGLLGLVFFFGGGLLMLWGAVRLWRPASSPATDTDDPAQRLALIGGVVVVVAWVLMILAEGWVLVAEQGIAVAAATTAVVLVMLHRSASSPLTSRSTSIALIVAAALALLFALYGLVEILPEWSFIVEFGGASMYLPFFGYMAGIALLAAGGLMTALSMRNGPVAGQA